MTVIELEESLRFTERSYYIDALARYNYCVARTAKELNISRYKLMRTMKRLKIVRPACGE